jgi:endoglucanase
MNLYLHCILLPYQDCSKSHMTPPPLCPGDGNLATDWRLGAERIAAVVLEANPRLLIFVEGVESACGEHSWWGGCFTAAAQAPVRLPLPDKLVYSPHVYGPSVHAQHYFSDPSFPDNLPPIWEKHFACVLKEGQGPAIVPGEWG